MLLLEREREKEKKNVPSKLELFQQFVLKNYVGQGVDDVMDPTSKFLNSYAREAATTEATTIDAN